MTSAIRCWLLTVWVLGNTLCSAQPPTLSPSKPSILRQSNLVAWCIVPFDAAKRGPADRAQMLKELGINRCAYDWRAEHVATFEQEILEYRKHGIEFFAFWSVHEQAFKLFEKYKLHPQIWQTLSSPAGKDQAARIDAAVQQLLPLAERTKRMGCKLGLYNHGGWGGEPSNLVAVCERLRELKHDHVGIVYNFHHGHGHIDDWTASLKKMLPYLHCLNLNGMNVEAKPKILGIGKGEHELDMIRTILDSDYAGPIGILDHRTELDARESLQENLDGVKRIRAELEPGKQTTSKCSTSKRREAALDSDFDPVRVRLLVQESMQHGDAVRGAAVFCNAKLACLSCHKIGTDGGAVGPELTAIAKDRTHSQIVESLLWPQRDVKPEFATWQLVLTNGKTVSGFKLGEDERYFSVKDPTSGDVSKIAKDDIEEVIAGGTVMPSGLLDALTRQQQRDLIRFLGELGRDGRPLSAKLKHAVSHSQMHGPVSFDFDKAPVSPERWPHSTAYVNRDRVYDFYAKQAEHYRQAQHVPMLLSAAPGLDGGDQGHWGNQNEQVWASDRWNETTLGSVQAGVFHADGLTVPRAVCVQLDGGKLSVCFNPDKLKYEAVWSDGFVGFSSVRHGFLDGLQMQGKRRSTPIQRAPLRGATYRGFYLHGKHVVFSYHLNGVEYLDAPKLENGEFAREVAPRDQHSMRSAASGGPAQWPQLFETKIVPGKAKPFSIDTIELPDTNPWKAQLFCSGHDFLPDGSALVCTMQGDVWHVSGLDSGIGTPGVARWRRFASGLHHPLGLVVSDDGIFVQCRDQLTRLSDLNGDGEADFYECYSNQFVTSPAGHDFICGLERDRQGCFYTVSGNQGLLRIAKDGTTAEVIATGFRNPDGLGVLADGSVTVPCSEGGWTPASTICRIKNSQPPSSGTRAGVPYFGFGGPKNGQPPELPLLYLPRGVDNSSGGQTTVPRDTWGPMQGQLLHFSFGMGSWFSILMNETDGQIQGAVVPLTGDFLSGAHRGRFSARDKHLYVSGMQGWGSYTPQDGCFQRVRYTGVRFQIPTGFHVYQNGVKVTFAEPLNTDVASNSGSHFAQCWNYRYSGAYGSPEYSTTHPGVQGHDPLRIAAAHVLQDRRSLFLEIPDLQPVSQLHLRMHVNAADEYPVCSPTGDGHDLFITVHRLDAPYTDLPGYASVEKTIAAHPMLSDIALASNRVPNPWREPIAGARKIELQVGKNLSYATRQIRVEANEDIALSLKNPDVVPHNWVLVRPGTLRRVGEMANRLIAAPKAFARHYVPESNDVLVYTDIVGPEQTQTIHFRSPEKPGTYPFLCTFPGHWMVMNGELIVE